MTSRSSNYPVFESWDGVLSALRSGEYTQGVGYMCQLHPEIEFDGTVHKEHCIFDVLGVLADVCGADWILTNYTGILCDDDGETEANLDVVDFYGLDQDIKDGELGDDSKYGPSFLYFADGISRRWEYLVYLNDKTPAEFPEIADEIERLGWHLN